MKHFISALECLIALLSTLALSCFISVFAQSQNATDDSSARVNKLFEAWDKPDVPGCAVAVIRDGRIIYERDFGMADLEHNVRITPATVFYIASTSKQFTAATIALLAQRGKLSVDDRLRKYIAELPDVYDGITIRQLFSHTSGIRDFRTLLGAQGRADDVKTEQDILELLARQKGLQFKPGTQYEYSNSGYFLLGVIVKRVSGKSLREFADENIFKPLGMSNTHFHDDRTMVVKNRAAGYVPRRGGGYSIYPTNFDVVGDGGVMTTVKDLSLWDQNFYANKLGGGQEFIAQLLTPGTLNDGEKLGYAYGLEIDEYKGLKTVSHDGGFGGFVTEMLRFPDQKFTVICLANVRGPIDSTALAYKVADIYLADAFKPSLSQVKANESVRQSGSNAVAPFSLTPTQLAEYVGDYYSDELQVTYKVLLEDNKLVARYRQVINGVLTPVGRDEFKLYGAIGIRFSRNNQNRITSFTPQNGGAKNILFVRP